MTAAVFTIHADRPPVKPVRLHGPPPRGIVLLSRHRRQIEHRASKRAFLTKLVAELQKELSDTGPKRAELVALQGRSDAEIVAAAREQLRSRIDALDLVAVMTLQRLADTRRQLAELGG